MMSGLETSHFGPGVIPGGCEATGKGIQGQRAVALDPLPVRYAAAGDGTVSRASGTRSSATDGIPIFPCPGAAAKRAFV